MTDTRREALVVKPLGWEWPNEYGLVCRAETPIGTYSISDDEDRPSAMLCYLHLTEDGDCTRYALEIADGYFEPDEVQAIAQADYERRILSALNLEKLRDALSDLQATLDNLLVEVTRNDGETPECLSKQFCASLN